MIDPERAEEVAPALLLLLRARLEAAQLGYAEAPARLLGGNQTFVHAFRLSGAEPPWDAPLVLRLLRAHRSGDEVVFESLVQNALAPLAPRVLLYEADASALGAAFQIMERVPGRALLLGEVGQEARGGGILRPLLASLHQALLGPWPQRLAETHARLHGLPPGPLLRALEAAELAERLRLSRRIDRLEAGVQAGSLDGLRPGLAWLRRREPELPGPRAICHGDLFPNQVYAEAGRVSGVIDWADVTLAPAGVDVGHVCAGIETIPLRIPGLGALRDRRVRRFREAYARLRTLDPETFRFGAVLRPLATLVALARYRAGAGPAPVPYDAAGGEGALVAHLARSGIEVRF